MRTRTRTRTRTRMIRRKKGRRVKSQKEGSSFHVISMDLTQEDGDTSGQVGQELDGELPTGTKASVKSGFKCIHRHLLFSDVRLAIQNI